jgi:hypothetical protein
MALVSTAPNAVAQKKQRDVITREEILNASQKDQDLLTAIKVLRPNFLQAPRGMRSLGGSFIAPLSVYVDRIRQPGTDVLRQIMANTVQEVRYLDPPRSENEYGISANGGALVIKLYKPSHLIDTLAKKPPQ